MYYFPRMNVPAIVKTLVITLVLSMGLGLGVAVALMAMVSSDVLSEETIDASALFNVALTAVGMIPDVVAGYLVAMFAKRHVYHHALVLSLALIALGAGLLMIPTGQPVPSDDWVRVGLTLPFVFCGTFLHQFIKRMTGPPPERDWDTAA